MEQIGPTFKAAIIGLMIVSGAINTIAYKFQNRQLVYEGAMYKYFFHPYMQAITMFFGQFMALIVFTIMVKRDPEAHKMRQLQARRKGLNIKINPFLLAIPALCDFVTSTLQYIALNFIPGSVYQMMRGGTIVTTFLFSICFLGMKIQRKQVIGAVLALVGVFIVGLSNMIFAGGSSSATDPSLQIVGYILIIGSLVFNGFFFVYEQKLFNKYYLEPLQVVGWEGLFGLCLYILVTPILNFIPCSFGQAACVFDEHSIPYMENTPSYFHEAGANGALAFFCILGVFSIATFNITGVTVTKYINALARSIGDVTRTILVWGVGLIVTVSAGAKYPNYEWELLGGGAIALQLLGFVILIMGNLIYNGIIKLPGAKPAEQPLLQQGDEDGDADGTDEEGERKIGSGSQITQNN